MHDYLKEENNTNLFCGVHGLVYVFDVLNTTKVNMLINLKLIIL